MLEISSAKLYILSLSKVFMKGQLSAEMLVLIAVVIAVVAIAATQLIKSAEKSSNEIDKRSDDVLATTEKAMKSRKGESCNNDDSCAEGLTCNLYTYTCE